MPQSTANKKSPVPNLLSLPDLLGSLRTAPADVPLKDILKEAERCFSNEEEEMDVSEALIILPRVILVILPSILFGFHQAYC